MPRHAAAPRPRTTTTTVAASITGALTAAVALLLVLGLTVAAPSAPPATVAPAPIATHHVEEDEPGWDCRTDGNQQCTPPAVPDRVTVRV